MEEPPNRGVERAPRAALATVLAALARLTGWIDSGFQWVTGVFLVILVSLNGIEVVSRSYFNYSLFWAFEIYQLLGNWMYFLGVTLVYHRAEDITLDYFHDRLDARRRRQALLAIHVATAATLLVLAWYGAKLLDLQSETRTTGLGIPNHYYSMPVLLSAVVMFFGIARQWLAVFLEVDDPGRGGA